MSPSEPSYDPGLKSVQGLLHPLSEDPRLHPKEEYRLCDRLIKGPDTFGSAPSLLIIRDNYPQLFCSFPRLHTTAIQSLSPSVNTLSRSLNSETFCIGYPYASKARSELSLVSASASRRLFRSAPFSHCAVSGCQLFKARLGTVMSHQAQHRWDKFSYSRITTVSRTCWCNKCTSIAVLVSTLPGHPSTGHFCGPPFAGKVIL